MTEQKNIRGVGQPPRNLLAVLSQSTCYSNKAGYRFVNLNRKENLPLFRTLKRVGFFSFHQSNFGQVVGVHQVVAFAYQGYKALARGFTAPKGEVEIHHLDSDPTNNHPNNLAYVSPQEHQIISDAVGTGYLGRVRNPDPCPFNNQGKEIKNPKQRLSYLIKLTFEATMAKLDRPLKVQTPEVMLYLPYNLFIEKTRGVVNSPLVKKVVRTVKSLYRKGKKIELMKLMRFTQLDFEEASGQTV